VTRHLILLPAAETDLSDIWDYTAERWSLKQAGNYASGMTALLILLCDQPEIAPIFGDLTPPIRVYRYRSHLVIFTANDLAVEVIRVVHARSNWQPALSD
jgi:toxin ParE1/3/4